MGHVTLTYQGIAIRQLDHALDLYLKRGDLVCALTLAGAAEEILGCLAAAAGKEPSLKRLALRKRALFRPGLVKVGYSTKDPVLRIDELSGTGLPYAFELEYDALVGEPRDVEQKVHKRLAAPIVVSYA